MLLIGLSALPLFAGEKKDPSRLTVARIFASKEFEPKPFSVRWLEDRAAYVTLEPAAGEPGGRDIVRHDPQSGKSYMLVPAAHLVPPGESSPLKIEDYSFSKDMALALIYTNSKRVWRRKTRGDYWVLDRASRELFQLGGDARPSTLMFAKLSPDGRRAAYVRQNNLYVEDLRDRRITPLTTSGSAEVSNGTFDWVYEEEFGLRDGFAWSPDGRSIAYWQIDARGVPSFPLVNETDSLYPRVTEVKYPKVGQRNSACRVGVVDLKTRRTRWMDVPGDPRNHYIARMGWAAGSRQLVLQQLNRRQNINRVMLADARTGAVRTVLTERDDAWVDVHDELKWLAGGKRFTWISQRDGWRHVYLVSRDGGRITLATPGSFDVIRLLQVDEKRGWLYFLASPDNPTRQFLYRVRLDGTGMKRLTPAGQPGTHDYQISPDARWATDRRSSFDTPPTVELVKLPDHAKVRTLAADRPLRKRVEKLRRRPVEFFRVDIGGGVLLDGWCMKPPEFDPARKYPLLIYVYGEPAGQTVVDRWGGKRYLWHLMLAQRGYLVMSFDNRGSRAPRGRAWRKAAFHKIGILAPRDQAAALRRVLAERSYVDPGRVGIWGWSGGGSTSLHAIFKHPDLYQTAMAVAPVANQRYYDTIYQERYMGLPGDNVEGFIEGSPINFAHNLRGNLLIVHGTGDDNCHYQATEALINELVRSNKPFTMMAYPNRTHAIREGANTTRHLHELLTRYLTENLPPGPAPEDNSKCQQTKPGGPKRP
jgi:dipeptidyl-peptidase-4